MAVVGVEVEVVGVGEGDVVVGPRRPARTGAGACRATGTVSAAGIWLVAGCCPGRGPVVRVAVRAVRVAVRAVRAVWIAGIVPVVCVVRSAAWWRGTGGRG